MEKITHDIPKPLVKIHGKPIMWYTFWTLYAHGFRNFILPLGYKGDMIEESKRNGHIELPHEGNGYYKGYEGVLDYCLHHLSPSPAGVEFRMYGHEVGQVSDYQYALENR